MTCEQASRLLSALVDGELEAPEKAAVMAHAEACTVCFREIQTLESLKDKFNGFGPAVPPQGLETRLNEAVFGKRKAVPGRLAVVGLLAASSMAAAWLAVRIAGPQPQNALPAVHKATEQPSQNGDRAYVTSTDPIDLGAPVVSVGFAGER